MVVLVCEVQLYLPDSRSLKHKRQVVKSIKDRLHNRFNISVAEVEDNDLWQRATLGLAVASLATAHAHAVVAKSVDFIESEPRLHLVDYRVEER